MLEARASAAVLVFSVLWLAVAAGLAILAARRMRRAQRVIDAARRLRALVEAVPARPLLVHRQRLDRDGPRPSSATWAWPTRPDALR